MECSLLIFNFNERIFPKKSTVSVEQSDGQELLLHKLGYSPTQYSLHLIPNSSLWAGLTQSTLTALSTSNHIAQKNIGTLLFEHDRHFSLVLAAKSEERDNDVIIEGEEYSTPKCDNLFHDVGESGYLTYHSSVATPVDDVIMTSCPQSKPTECAKLKAAKSEERDNDVIIEGEEYSTPKCGDNRFHDVGESGYSTYHSSVATPVDDVIMTSSLQSKPTTECAKLNESCSTIIVSDSEYEIEDPLPTKAPALPGLFSHRLHPQSVGEKSTFQPTSPYFLPPHQKRSSPAKVDISNPSSRCSQKQRGPTLRDKVVIIVSSSDEAELPSLTTSVGHQSSIRQESGRSPQSSDEGIVLDSRWEESRSSSRVETPSVLGTSIALTDEGQIHGEGQVLNKQKASDRTVVVKCGGYDLTLADLRTLEPHQWLNDQIINCYMQLLTATYGRQYRVHIMSTFFYTKLSRCGYPGVERWLRRVNMKRLWLLLVPVHVSMCHWALAAINFRAKKISYFDSLGIRNTSCLKRLKVFMRKYTRAQRYPYLLRWRLHYAKGIPHQQNGSDCGVFVCQFARWLCSTLGSKSYSHTPFQQRDMPRLRKTMLDELKKGTLQNCVCNFY